MQTLTDIRIYTGITRCDGPDVSLQSVNSVGGAELHVYTSEGEKYVIEVPDGGVYDYSIQPIPQYEHACKKAASNVLATLLRGADGKGVKGGYFDEDGTLYLIMEDASEVAVGKISLENYYTKNEVDAKRLANPYALGISVNGDTVEYDGRASISLPRIYAPLSQGGSAQVLVGGSPAPQWVDVSKLAGVYVDWSNIISKPTTIKGYGITDCYTRKEIDPTIEKANSALQSIISPELEDGDYVSLSVGKKTGGNIQEVRVAAHIAQLNTSADGLVTASDARAYIEQAKTKVAENIEKQGFAKDLTGVIEATPEEFTYRPSAGDKSIRDASAVIRRIKGNTVVFAQLSDHASSLQREGDWSVAVEVTANTWGTFSKPVQVIAGHKYLFYINKKDGRSITDAYTLLKGAHTVYFNEPLFIESKETASWGWTARYQTSTNGLRFQTQAFDLTRLFGVGNEPTTIEEFRSKIPDSYYPYSEPEVRNVITNLITTIGFNQWDEQWELGALATDTGGLVGHQERGRSINFFDVIPNASYYCATTAPTTTNSSGTVGAMLVWWYDSSQNFIKYEDITNRTRVAPSNARYAKICSYGGDVNAIFGAGININLSHSGVRDGEYEPYKRNTRLLPEINKYFPDGMNGNANVCDEINTEYAIKRWGVVDLGTLTWSAQGTNTDGEYRWEAKGISTPPTATVSTIPNIICAKYTTGSNENTFARKDCVSISASGNIRIFDSNYKETSSKEALVASLRGVLLYYELAEPIETPITEAIQLDYVVDDFGTEKASGYGNSAPFRADIVYQFNAEGRIRDNSRNIERIESNIQRVENTVTTNLIPSQTAMLGLPNKVMTWNGRYAMMSLPIANSFAEWEMEESPLGVLPTGKQVMDYIDIIKGSLATGLIPKETLEIGADGVHFISPNKTYEITTASSTEYNIGLEIVTTSGVDVVADNEWRIRIDTRSGFRGSITIEPLTSGYSIRWAYPEASGVGTAPTIAAGYIWDIQLRMIGKTLLGTYKKY